MVTNLCSTLAPTTQLTVQQRQHDDDDDLHSVVLVLIAASLTFTAQCSMPASAKMTSVKGCLPSAMAEP